MSVSWAVLGSLLDSSRALKHCKNLCFLQVLDITLDPPHNIDLDLFLVVFQAFWADLGAFLVALDHILASKTGPKTRQNGDLIQGPFLEPKLLEN